MVLFLFVAIDLLGPSDCYESTFLSQLFPAFVEKTKLGVKVLIAIDLPSALPVLNCSDYVYFPRLRLFPLHVLHQIKNTFGTFRDSEHILNAWLNRFAPSTRYAEEVLDTFKLQLTVGIQCSRLCTVMPASLRDYIEVYGSKTQSNEASKYHGVRNTCYQVFCFHHGLRPLASPIRDPLKSKSVIDIGTFNGDSALVLSDYAKALYSLELSQKEFLDSEPSVGPKNFVISKRPCILF
jgi:hypothetical protein